MFVLALLEQLQDEKYLSDNVLTRELKVRFLVTCTAVVLSPCYSTRSKRVPNPGCFIIAEQDTCLLHRQYCRHEICLRRGSVFSPWSPTSHRTGALERRKKYKDVDLPSSGLLRQFPSENTLNMKPLADDVRVRRSG